MAAISQLTFSNALSLMKIFFISIQMSLFIPKGSIDKKSALVRVMAWCRTGDKPLPEPRLTYLTDAYMRH